MSATNLFADLRAIINEEINKQLDEKQILIDNLTSLISEIKTDQDKTEEQYNKQIDLLKKEIEEYRINKLGEQDTNVQYNTIYDEIKPIRVLEDPRIKNRGLPYDATLTYKYKARAYISDVYPGFVWRNGVWYKENANLVFKPMSPMKLQNIKKTYIEDNHLVNINDWFEPIILNNGHRLFIMPTTFINKYDNLYNVFVLDTNHKYYNEIKKIKDEFYKTFNKVYSFIAYDPFKKINHYFTYQKFIYEDVNYVSDDFKIICETNKYENELVYIKEHHPEYIVAYKSGSPITAELIELLWDPAVCYTNPEKNEI